MSSRVVYVLLQIDPIIGMFFCRLKLSYHQFFNNGTMWRDTRIYTMTLKSLSEFSLKILHKFFIIIAIIIIIIIIIKYESSWLRTKAYSYVCWILVLWNTLFRKSTVGQCGQQRVYWKSAVAGFKNVLRKSDIFCQIWQDNDVKNILIGAANFHFRWEKNNFFIWIAGFSYDWWLSKTSI